MPPSPLGYSCAGKVIAVAPDIIEFSVGDMVACGGEGAFHAEVTAVKKNLCVKIPAGVKPEYGAYTTVAAIAMQGIRQADIRLGESCAIIGLGLIGQLTIQMLKASGIKVVGIDIDQQAVELAKKSGSDVALNSTNAALEQTVYELSGGYGVDAVIITAGTSSLDPVELAGKLCRRKGKVIIVGAVPTGFSRPNYYKKELELRMSSSYGPGRYDGNYEDKGLDYPIGYVRWTENRNMGAFLGLCASNSLNIDLLTTHTFEFKKAKDAFDMIMEKSELFVGILFKYDTKKELTQKYVSSTAKEFLPGGPNIGFIGAGSFAQKVLLPNAAKYGKMVAVATATGNDTRNAVDKYGFKQGFGDAVEITGHKDIDTVFIATRHILMRNM
ncbi:MAG: zinc-binding dehydrogenase [Bacteroidales bacterium]|nr:zinc-binding dehydrogenase [Bacteroidales bacterium]